MNDAPEKLYYSISEVSDATGVKAHVLRYWESQFPMLRPRKSRGGMRMYRAKDAAIIQRIKYLLYDRGFTIAGARRKLFEDRRSGISYDAFEPEAREASYSIREEMRAARQGENLEPPADAPAAASGGSSGLNAAAAPGAPSAPGASAPPGPLAAPGASISPGIGSRQLEFGSAPDVPEATAKGTLAAGPEAMLQEIRTELEVLQAMLMAPPRLKIRT